MISHPLIFSLLKQIVSHSVLPLFGVVISSGLTSCLMILVAQQLNLSQWGQLNALGYGFVGLIFVRFCTGFYMDALSSFILRRSQGSLTEIVSEELGNIRKDLSAAQSLHHLSDDLTNFLERVVYGFVQALSGSVIIIVLGFYLIQLDLLPALLVLPLLVAGLLVSYLLQSQLRVYSEAFQKQEAEIFNEQKNLIYGWESLFFSGGLSAWNTEFKKKLKNINRLEWKLSLFHHSKNQLAWGFKLLFVLALISPLALFSGLKSEVLYWMYMLLGLALQFYESFAQCGEVQALAARLHPLVKKEDVSKNQSSVDSSIKAKGLQIFFGHKDKNKSIGPFHFSFQKGENVWIQGESGSGKTTLLKTFCGLHHNYSGEILLPEQKFISYAPAEAYMFEGKTLAQNIGCQSIKEIDPLIIEGLSLTSLFEAMDSQLSPIIGSEDFHLSMGQRTRIGLLRALLYPAYVYLFDEPTAHLDDKVSKQVIEFLSQYLKRQTLIVCEHKLDLSRAFDMDHCIDLKQKKPNNSKHDLAKPSEILNRNPH